MIAQFGEKKRIPKRIEDIPKQLLNAFLAAEDDSFYSHPGIDIKGLIRAAIQLLITGKKSQGGSTITMQVARNFLLSREKTYIRKIKEIILSIKIEQEYSKDKILELYLNKIYLGQRAYGIAAASQTYYGKSLDMLNLAQNAMLAGLPKAPSSYNPISNPERALIRRNYVLGRMLELHYINQTEFDDAIKATVTAKIYKKKTEMSAPFVAEMVRQAIYSQYGEEAYTLGFNVYTTIESKLQSAADRALRNTLHLYDQRHGYRGLPHQKSTQDIPLSANYVGDTQVAKVTGISRKFASAVLADYSKINIPWRNIAWARKFKSRYSVGKELDSISDVLAVDDLIRVRKLDDNTWALSQIPEVEGAMIAMNSETGEILALSGGFDYFHNKYNRVTQSKRQPGSGFKPIIYTTALEHGFTPASIVNDAPVVVEDPAQDNWRPENYSRKFFGPTSLRTALRKSRNLISIRLLRELGLAEVKRTAIRFGFEPEQLPNSLSLALGSGNATPLQMARVYAAFANGGYLVEPYFIRRIENEYGELLAEPHPAIICQQHDCTLNPGQKPPEFAPQIMTPAINFLMDSLLRDVVQRGTASKAKTLGRADLAGKTGTTNEQRDAWFNGYGSDLVGISWIGFDDSSPLGHGETGSKAALPMWIEFMKTALKGKPEKTLTMPENITKAYINPKDGLLAKPDSGNGYWEYFLKENAPVDESPEKTEEELYEYPNGNSLF